MADIPVYDEYSFGSGGSNDLGATGVSGGSSGWNTSSTNFGSGQGGNGGGLGFGVGSVVGGIESAAGDLMNAAAYKDAEKFTQAQGKLVEQQWDIKATQQQRAAYQAQGATTAAIAGAGLKMQGTALDLVHEGARNEALDASQIQLEKTQQVEQYNYQARVYSREATASDIKAGTDVLNGILGAFGL